MSDKNKNFKISLGILVGYFLAALINVLFFDKSWVEAITDKKLLYILAAVVCAGLFIKRTMSK
ncbi:hypothetical protein [Kordia sp.]|uniref:hypothetical protein n=1 Tax=Kordia sp. TaxID=1965332 RepID=UPI003D6BE3A1